MVHRHDAGGAAEKKRNGGNRRRDSHPDDGCKREVWTVTLRRLRSERRPLHHREAEERWTFA
jgi:hypothetical protein